MEYDSDPEIKIWNIVEGITNFAGAQSIFNVTGNVSKIEEVTNLSYSLNDDQYLPIVLKKHEIGGQRLEREGDFNIDTINIDSLKVQNKLTIKAKLRNTKTISKVVNFRIKFFNKALNNFKLNLDNINYPQEVGQVVDGRWVISQQKRGKRCVEIIPEDSGLDRIILFSGDNLRTNYKINLQFSITQWTGIPHNIGVVFKWNPHKQGDGSALPSQWSTGLAYYYSNCRGLRIRIGKNVHFNSSGEKVGDWILGEEIFSFWRFMFMQIIKKFFKKKIIISQLIPGEKYNLEVKLKDNFISLSLWKAHYVKPYPQVIVSDIPNLLSKGSVGVIAHRCALKIYKFKINHYGLYAKTF